MASEVPSVTSEAQSETSSAVKIVLVEVGQSSKRAVEPVESLIPDEAGNGLFTTQFTTQEFIQLVCNYIGQYR